VFSWWREPDPRITRSPFPEDTRRFVGGAVVDDDELEVTPLLRQHTVEGFVEVVGAVEDAHHHRDFGTDYLLMTSPHPTSRSADPYGSSRELP
jgi:hypothetical protein